MREVARLGFGQTLLYLLMIFLDVFFSPIVSEFSLIFFISLLSLFFVVVFFCYFVVILSLRVLIFLFFVMT